MGIDWNKVVEGLPDEPKSTWDDEGAILFSRILKQVPGIDPSTVDVLMEKAQRVDHFEIRDAVQHYGPFWLHRLVAIGKDGRVEEEDQLQILIGEHETPIILPVTPDAALDPAQREAVSDACIVGTIPVGENTLAGTVRTIKRRLRFLELSATAIRDWQRECPDEATARDDEMQRNERDARIVGIALRAVEAAYRDELMSLDTDMSAEEDRLMRERLAWAESWRAGPTVPPQERRDA